MVPLLALLWELPYAPGEAVLVYRAYRRGGGVPGRSGPAGRRAGRGRAPPARPPGPSGRPGCPATRAAWTTRRRCAGSPDIASHDVFLCGPDGWVDAVRAATGPPGCPTHTAGAAPPTGSGSGSGQVDGSVAQTRWGPVQVRISTSAGKITEVTALQVPDGNFRDQQINDYAVPILRQEALAAQSAQIDTVSGATVTSDGYRESLQAAIDAAHLK